MLDSKACEELIDDLDKYEFYKYEDNIQIAIINKELDITDLIKTKSLIKGELYYDNINKHLLFVYEDCLYKDEVYKIGEIEDYYDSSFDLIKNMENKEYLLMRRK